MKKIRIQRVIGIFLTVCVMIFIFFMSAQNAKISANTSGSLIAFFAKLITPRFTELSVLQQSQIIASYQLIVRKGAHFSIYLVLGITASIFTLTLEKIKKVLRYALSAVIALLYAISDEIHQLYVPGRVGALTDVLIDFGGTLTGLLILALILFVIKKKEIKKRLS